MKKITTALSAAFVAFAAPVFASQTQWFLDFQHHDDGGTFPRAYTTAMLKSDFRWAGLAEASGLSGTDQLHLVKDADGNVSLRITLRANNHEGPRFSFPIQAREDYQFESKVRFADNWAWGGTKQGGKLIGSLVGGNWGKYKGGQKNYEGDGFTARLSWANQLLKTYVYHMDRPSKFGENLNFNISDLNATRTSWRRIGYKIKLNDPGLHNGLIHNYHNGNLSGSRTNYRFRSSTAMYKIDAFYFSCHVGGGSNEYLFPATTYFYMDDLKIWPLGQPIPTVPNSSSAGAGAQR